MKQNIGNLDRYFRIGLGTVILVAGYLSQSLWGFLGLIPFLTGVIRICPLYLATGISTHKEDSGELSSPHNVRPLF